MKKPPEVAEAVYRAIRGGELGNPARGSHRPALQALRQTEQVRLKVANFFHLLDSTQVSFTQNATFALNILLKSLLSPGDEIITSRQEHNSVLRPLYQLEKEGVQLHFLDVDKDGNVQLEQLDFLVTNHTKAVILNHMSNVTGNVIDLQKVGDFCRQHQLIFIVDVAQSAGTVPIDMNEMGVDALCFTGHKSLYGPQGTGGICINHSNLLLKPVFSGGSGSNSYEKEMPSELPVIFEPGTLNVPGIVGLGAGLDFVEEKTVSQIQKELSEMTLYFLSNIETIPGIQIYGKNYQQVQKKPQSHGPIVSLNIEGWNSGDLADALDQDYGIAVRSGAHCAPLIHEHFQTVKRGMVRFSFSTLNNKEELDYAINALKELSEE